MAMLPAPVRLKGGKIEQRTHITFGSDMPQRPGDFGIEVVGGMTWLVRALEADETLKRRRDEEQELHFQRLMPADALRIRGRHNAVNALSALALAVSAGCPLGPMLYGLREYRGEPHRVEPVGFVGDVEFFDDSKGTNVGATVAALQGLGADRKLVVILGGDGKGQDFSPLADPVARHARAAVLIGRWGMALSLVVGAVLAGRLIRAFPYLLPNRLPGLVLYELGPALILGVAIGAAIAITHDLRPGIRARLARFALAALVAGAVTLAVEFDAALQGRWL
jgi:hypothetical protein